MIDSAKKIVITGFMGSGKSKLGSLAAGELNIPHYDLDQLIEKKFNHTINQLFQKYGESWFRKNERSMLLQFMSAQSSHRSYILSLGGGSLQSQDLIRMIKKEARIVYIKVDFDILFKRITKRKTRPLLLDKSGKMKDLDHLYDELSELFNNRSSLYEQADYIYCPRPNYSKELNAQALASLISN